MTLRSPLARAHLEFILCRRCRLMFLKVASPFCSVIFSSNHEFTGEVIGSLQMLVKIPATTAGFEYCWLPYEQVVYLQKLQATVILNTKFEGFTIHRQGLCTSSYESRCSMRNSSREFRTAR